ncbi:MAG: hypothetical protein AB7N91_20425 [Candidatus Tectimicrobiota bacterium]
MSATQEAWPPAPLSLGKASPPFPACSICHVEIRPREQSLQEDGAMYHNACYKARALQEALSITRQTAPFYTLLRR